MGVLVVADVVGTGAVAGVLVGCCAAHAEGGVAACYYYDEVVRAREGKIEGVSPEQCSLDTERTDQASAVRVLARCDYIYLTHSRPKNRFIILLSHSADLLYHLAC